jgi:hypothetical protein
MSNNSQWHYVLAQALTAGISAAIVAQFADGRCAVAADIPGQEGGSTGVYTAWQQTSTGFTVFGAAGSSAAAGLGQLLKAAAELVQQASSQSNAKINSEGSLTAMPGAALVSLNINSDGSSGQAGPTGSPASTATVPTNPETTTTSAARGSAPSGACEAGGAINCSIRARAAPPQAQSKQAWSNTVACRPVLQYGGNPTPSCEVRSYQCVASQVQGREESAITCTANNGNAMIQFDTIP